MAYLGWPNLSRVPVSGVSPFTYPDGVTYLEKLEDLYQGLGNIGIALNDLIAQEGSDFAAINAAYVALVADWNAVIGRLDPTNVRALVEAFESKYGPIIDTLNTTLSALEAKDVAHDAAIKAANDAMTAIVKTIGDNDTATKTIIATKETESKKRDKDNADLIGQLTTDAVLEAEVDDRIDARIIDRLSTPPNGVLTALSNISSKFPAKGRQAGMFYLSTYCTTEGQRNGSESASDALDALMVDLRSWAANRPLIPGSSVVSGGTIIVDGSFLLTRTAFANGIPKGLTIQGFGRYSSAFIQSSGDFISLSPGQWTDGCVFTNFAWNGQNGAGVFLKMRGADASNESIMVGCMFSQLTLTTKSTVNGLGDVQGYSEYHDNHWIGCSFDKIKESTAYTFYFYPSQGNLNNSNSFRCLWVHGHNSTSKPAFFVGGANAAWQNNWTFEDICGEQNGGGLIDLRGVNMARISNCIDWDSTVGYTQPVIYVRKNTSGTPSHNVIIEASGRPVEQSLPGNVYDIFVENGCRARVSQCNPQGVKGSIIAGDMTAVDGSKEAFTYAGGSYQANDMDDAILCTNAGVTITLPDPGTSYAGRKLTVINASPGNITIAAPNGKSVNGNATFTQGVGAKTYYADAQMRDTSGRWVSN